MKKLTTTLLVIALPFFLISQTIVDSLNVYGTWTKAESPYLINHDIAVASYDTLVIEPGVEVIFEDYYLFQVFGHFFAAGNESDSIYFTVSDTTGYFTNTHASWGGLDFLYSTSSSELIYCVIEYSRYNGIYINSYGDLIIANSYIHSNNKGIHAWAYYGEMNVTNSLIINNSCGIECWSSHSIFINDIIISENGCGIALLGMSTIQLSDFTISNNTGRGIWSGSDYMNHYFINDGILKNNAGGGVHVGWGDDLEISNVIIEENGPTAFGGGINSKGFCLCENVTIRNNSAERGGGVACSQEGMINIANSIIENNIAEEEGGGIYSIPGIFSFILDSVKISNNFSNIGGGIYLSMYYTDYCDLLLDHVEISNNHAFLKAGGAYCKLIPDGGGLVSNWCRSATITDNTADYTGGGIVVDQNSEDTLNIYNCIIWNNSPNEIIDSTGKLKVSYSNIEGGYPGIGNINSNPMFIDPINGDYNLSWLNFPLDDYTKSPCIDSSSDSTDMGAYPFDRAYYEQFLPVIGSVSDVPSDQGKQIVINWTRSILDNPYDGTIDKYTIWRMQNWTKEPWEYIGEVPAQNFEEYASIAPTVSDSTANGIPYFTFMVTAVDVDSNKFYYSYPDSSYSVDNLAPSEPVDFTGSYNQDTIKLTWQLSPEEDFSYYSIYRSDNTNNFPALPIATIESEYYYDIDLVIDTLYYQLTATDFNGNESTSTDPVEVIVPKEVILDVKVYLEGSYLVTGMIPYLNLSGLLPYDQPYNTHPWYYEGLESVPSISNLNIVDWMLVELRDGITVEEAANNTSIAKSAVFVLNDGTLIAFDQLSLPRIEAEIQNNLFIVLHHRNHMSIMSSSPVQQVDGVYTYNFAIGSDKVYGGDHVFKLLSSGNWGMISGEASGDGQINNVDKNDYWYSEYLSNGYKVGDFNMDGIVDDEDKNDFLNPNLGKGIQ